MEGMPNQDHNKKIEKQDLVNTLLSKGFEDPEAQTMLGAWITEKQREVNLKNTVRANIEFELERAELYYTTGYEYAYEAFEETRLYAHSQNDAEMYKKICDRMDEIERGGLEEDIHN